MKYIRRFSLAALIVLLLSAVPFAAFAHSGRTDSDGGHYDRSTGEYHWHHGEDDHQHYDMDGDGDLDCPYYFKDETDASGGSQCTVSKFSKTDPNSSTYSTDISTNTKIERVSTVPTWVYWVFAGSAIVIIILYFSNKNKSEDIALIKFRHQQEIKSTKASCEKEIAERLSSVAEIDALKNQIASSKKELADVRATIEKEAEYLENIKLLRSRMKHAPLDVSFAKDGMPVYWKPSLSKPYGDYTVYINKTTNIYHIDHLCASYRASKTHIFNVIHIARPCKKCAEGFFDFSTAPDWFDKKD